MCSLRVAFASIAAALMLAAPGGMTAGALEAPEVPATNTGDITICAVTEKVTTERIRFTSVYPRFFGLGDKGAQTKLNAEMRDRIHQSLARAKAAAAALLSDDRSGQRTVEGIVGYEVKRNNGGLVSLLFSDYLYGGGANGVETKEGLTFFSGTGQILTLGDVFTNSEQGIGVVNVEIDRQLEERGLKSRLLTADPAVGANQAFYIRQTPSTDGACLDELVVVVPELTWFSHATGTVEFPIPFDRLEGVLRPDMAGYA